MQRFYFRDDTMENSNQPEVYFHVGLGKTGTTYLQYSFFPKLKDICYIQRTRYSKSPEIINRKKCDKYLVSREFDRQFDREVKKFAGKFPNAKPIIVLRRQDSWIASQYRRFVKNGRQYSFPEFVDVENNNGVWDRDELLFFRRIKLLEEQFDSTPLVLLHDDLKKEPWQFFDRICEYTGASYDPEKISLNPSHTSYSLKQLKYVKRISPYLVKSQPQPAKNKLWHWIRYRSRWLLLHLVLYVTALLPEGPVKNEVLIAPNELEKVRNVYKEDWAKCVEYAKRQKQQDVRTLKKPMSAKK